MPILTQDPYSPAGGASSTVNYVDPIYDIDDAKTSVFDFAAGVANATAFVRGEVVLITGGYIAKLAALPAATDKLGVIAFPVTKSATLNKTSVYTSSISMYRDYTIYGTLTANAATFRGVNSILAAQGISVRSDQE
jgi:hypothetical protein